MFEYFLGPGNTPFTVALVLMFAMTVIEIVSISLGIGLSEIVDSFLPEFDADIDLDVDGLDSMDSGSSASSILKILAWFRIGEVPVVMLFIIFLTGFGMSGLLLQYLARETVGTIFPYLLVVPVAFACAVPMVRAGGGVLGKYMPKDETYAVSEKSFHGLVATVTLGTAKAGKPAQAKLYDKHGQSHYILVEPDDSDGCFNQGNQVIVVGQVGATYKVIGAAGAAKDTAVY